MLILVSLCPAVFLGDPSLKMEFFEHVPIQYRSTLEYKKCAYLYHWVAGKNWEFLGSWFLSYEFLFKTSGTLRHFVGRLFSSSTIQWYLCIHDYPNFWSTWENNFCRFTISVGNVLILESHLKLQSSSANTNWWSPRISIISTPLCLCFLMP
jgi:hypothetical protein